LLNPQGPIAYEDLAAAYIQLNQIDDAVTELRAALKLAPDSPQIHYDLGLALKFRDDSAASIPEFEAAERLDPNAPEPPYALGQLYLQAGRYPEAARELKRSLDLRPANGDGWATLGSVYNSLDKLPEAVSALQEAVKQLPGQPEPHLTLASVLIKEKKPDQATQERKIAADLMRANMNLQRAEVTTNAGNNMLRHGDVSGAEGRYREALSYDPKYREAHLGLARALESEGRALEAAAERKLADTQSTEPPTP
jgi:protein O-GlcNAc transferase